MRCLIQRVKSASVVVDGATIGEIDQGLLILVCAMGSDSGAEGEKLARKISKLRIFKDAEGRMNKSVTDIGGGCLVVSQFTLAANTKSGNRPGFSAAAAPDIARAQYDTFCDDLRGLGLPVQTGEFGADMAVSLVNDGPVTIWIDSDIG
ncbi:D-aminoacyl-tRNA deacylase [Amylibacter marinus]|uniref:D-aminoacyl-tRNA deacylase n=1 Tax=Amylibacter marinus TaxID=1475483 RepID=A0ABQ5VR36_9RHOB|nr:D-aminoacyl-tRNA deacylase [Amylibacter marinus]GLQ33760.1 D-aminoacyl-tRNA deacylase [Amylibacter marinus]